MSASWISRKFAVTQTSMRHDQHQRLPRRRVDSLGRGQFGHAAPERRDERRAGQIGVGLGELRLRLLALRLPRLPLGRDHGELTLRLGERRLRRVPCGLFLDEIGMSLLGLLQGAGTLLQQGLRPLILVLRIGQGRLGLRYLQGRLVDRRLLHLGLSFSRGDRRLGLRDLGVRLGLGREGISVVEPLQNLAGLRRSRCRSRERR